VYVYRYAHLQPQCDVGNVLGIVPRGPNNFSSTWASHGAELVMVFNVSAFGNPLGKGTLRCNFTASEHRLIASMQSLWGGVARAGRPADTTPAAVDWPRFTGAGEDGGAGEGDGAAGGGSCCSSVDPFPAAAPAASRTDPFPAPKGKVAWGSRLRRKQPKKSSC